MNAFEDIVKQYFEDEGYWVKNSVKIENITKDDKKEIGLKTMPRPEIDLVALNFKGNELLLIEVKSFLDSYGVWFGDDEIGKFKKDSWAAKRYRLFADNTYQAIVSKRLKEYYLEKGLINDKTVFRYALAVGKFHNKQDEDLTKEVFIKNNWILFSPSDIREKLKDLAKRGWEDNVATVTAKLILKD
jgi:hypothetical protein